MTRIFCFILIAYMAKIDIKESNSTSLARLAWLWLCICLHVLSGVFVLLIFFPFISSDSKKFHIQAWSSKLLVIFGIELKVNNPEILSSNSYLLASNHISWMDIHAINSFKPIRFVAKSEVANWPIFGWMAKQLGTVFIERANSRHAHIVVGEMARTLNKEPICIFPEGTSTNGESVRPFKSNLFESAIAANVPLNSLAIRYLSKVTNKRSEAPAFVGEMTLLDSMNLILNNRNLIVELTFFSTFDISPSNPVDRKWLAVHSHDQISQFLTRN